MTWHAITFATPEFATRAEAWQRMIACWGGEGVVVERRSTGSWARNTGLKPGAILAGIGRLPPGWVWVLYTDADAVVDGVPEIPHLDWDVGLLANPNPRHVNRVAASAIFLRNTQGALAFLRQWHRRCRQRPGLDHPRLTDVIIEMNSKVSMVAADGWLRFQQVASGGKR